MRRENQGFWFHEPHRRLDRLDTDTARRAVITASSGRWQWLDALRGRLDCDIELLTVGLDYVLDPITDSRSGIDLRRVLGKRLDPSVRDAFIGAVRSAQPATVAMHGVTIRACPLFIRSHTPALAVGLLVVASRDAVDAERRIDGVIEWLAPAMEASLLASFEATDELRIARAFVGVYELIGTLAKLDDDERILTLTMEAIALWHDADVRVYRQAVSGAFVLQASLPGAVIGPGDHEIPGHGIWGREDMFTTDASGETVDEWPSGPGLTRFIPISVEDSTEWLLAISGGTIDVAAEGPLRILGHLLGALLTNLHRNGIERMRRRLTTIFAFGDAPFDATAQIVLDAIAAEMDASEASVTIFYPPDPTPILRFGRGSGEVPFVEAGSAEMTADHISVGVAASAGVTMVLDLRRAGGPFGRHAGRFARAAAALVGIWVSGILIKPRDVQMRQDSHTSARFDDRAASYIDRLGRLAISGAVVVLVPERGEVTGQALDEALDILHERLRPNDTMGVIDAGGAAVLLPDVTQAVAGSVVARLMQAARRRGLESARVGLATFAAAAETLGSVINRALMNAGGGPLFHA